MRSGGPCTLVAANVKVVGRSPQELLVQLQNVQRFNNERGRRNQGRLAEGSAPGWPTAAEAVAGDAPADAPACPGSPSPSDSITVPSPPPAPAGATSASVAEPAGTAFDAVGDDAAVPVPRRTERVSEPR